MESSPIPLLQSPILPYQIEKMEMPHNTILFFSREFFFFFFSLYCMYSIILRRPFHHGAGVNGTPRGTKRPGSASGGGCAVLAHFHSFSHLSLFISVKYTCILNLFYSVNFISILFQFSSISSFFLFSQSNTKIVTKRKPKKKEKKQALSCQLSRPVIIIPKPTLLAPQYAPFI